MDISTASASGDILIAISSPLTSRPASVGWPNPIAVLVGAEPEKTMTVASYV